MHISRLSELGYYREAFRSSEALRRPAVLHWRRGDLDHDSLHLPIWIVNRSVRLDPTCERALFRCTVVEAAAQSWDMLKPLREEIEACYCNGYLAKLALAWATQWPIVLHAL